MPERKPVLWEPMREMMEDFEDTFNRFFLRPRSMRRRFPSDVVSPDVDVIEKENKIIVRADIPGMNKEDIHVNVEKDTLTIRGERKKEETIKDENYFCSERFYGAFSRTVKLPFEVDRDKIQARYKNGILSIELLKSKEMLAKEVEIKVE